MSDYFKVFWDGAGWYAPTSGREGQWGQQYTAYAKMSDGGGLADAQCIAQRSGYGTPFWVSRESEIIGSAKPVHNSDLYVD